jgi:hypothetical protein
MVRLNLIRPRHLSIQFTHVPSLIRSLCIVYSIASGHNDELLEPVDTGTATSPLVIEHSTGARTGGTCLHRSSHNHTLCQAPLLSSEAFCQEMISKYGSSNNTRGRKKRHAADEWTSCPALAQHYKSTLFNQDQEALLQNLETKFGGNVDAAELDMRVQLSHGTGAFCSLAMLIR